MEKRVLIAVVLSFLVLYGYQAWFVKPAPPGAGVSSAAKQGHAGLQEKPDTCSPVSDPRPPGQPPGLDE